MMGPAISWGNRVTKVPKLTMRPLGPGVAPVDVDGVAHGLEGVEGDADGQMDVQHRHEVQPHRLEGGGQEVPVLEEAAAGARLKNMEDATAHAGASVVVPCLTSFHQHAVGVVDSGGRNMMTT